MLDAGVRPDPWQVALLRSTAPHSLLCCARQVGKSTVTAFLALHTALTQPNTTTTIVAPVEEQANELLRKVTAAYHAIGAPVGIVREAVTRLELGNGSRVLALLGKESRMRSYSSALLVIDEAARVGDDVVNAASPTMAVSKGRFVALSTAFAKSGWFYKQWTDEPEPYLRLSIKARDCPRISPAFLASERRKLGQRWFAMEYENQFGDDVAAVFRVDDIRACRSSEVQPLFAIAEGVASPYIPNPAEPAVRPLF
jgi:Terminase large subunit, T4likevirus-type, N-terminal